MERMDRLPAIPLITSDPYLSIWMPADTMTQTDAAHWSGPVKPIRGAMTVDGAPVRLTATEYRIVALLMQNPGRVYNAEEIYERVWNEPGFSVENTVMVHIRRIREKIEINPKNPKYLKVVWGLGYKMEKAQ